MGGATGPVRVSETRAKQGRRGLHIFWVLGISMGLASLALLAAWAWGWGDLAKVRGQTNAPPAQRGSSTRTRPLPARRRPIPDGRARRRTVPGTPSRRS